MTMSNLNTNKLQAQKVTPNADFSNTATGTYSSSGIDYKYVTFTSGTNTLTIGTAGVADVLIVGGGGSGVQATTDCGGGAGGYIYETLYLAAGNYTVVVGAGASAGSQARGADSRINDLIAIGGAGTNGSTSTFGASTAGIVNTGSAGTYWAGQGNAGAQVASGGAAAGGGAGGAASGSTVGAGISNSITGTAVTYSQGGSAGAIVNGPANTGQGGGRSGSGGSGVVVVRVRTN